MIEEMPLPITDNPIDAPFWKAALRSELIVQLCEDCGAPRHPPRAMCPHCQSIKVGWTKLSGWGRIWSFATPQPPLLPVFAKMVPYVCAVVETVEFPEIRLVGPLLAASEDKFLSATAQQIKIGQTVNVKFFTCTEDVALAGWVLADDDAPIRKGEK